VDIDLSQFEVNELLVGRLFEKRKLLIRGDKKHEEIRPVLINLSGGMRGAGGGGSAVALSMLGLNDVFDTIVGVSVGAAIAAYFIAGHDQTLKGASLFYEELCSSNFINFLRPHKIADLDFLAGLFREGEKRLNVEKIKKSRSELLVAVTDFITDDSKLISAKNVSDIVILLKASAAQLFLYSGVVMIDGRRFVDGAISFSLQNTIIEFLNRQNKPTDILIIANRRRSWLEHKPFAERLLRVMSQSHTKAFLERRNRLIQSLKFIETLAGDGINVGIIWLPEDIPVTIVTTDAVKLRALSHQSMIETLHLFGVDTSREFLL